MLMQFLIYGKSCLKFCFIRSLTNVKKNEDNWMRFFFNESFVEDDLIGQSKLDPKD